MPATPSVPFPTATAASDQPASPPPPPAADDNPPVETSSLLGRLRQLIGRWARSQHKIVVLAADLDDSGDWALVGARTAAHWLALAADIEVSTAREWVRVGRCIRTLPLIQKAFADGDVSYTKVRALTRLATPDNEAELLGLARSTRAGSLPRALAAWFASTVEPEELERHQHARRSVRWRIEPDGMTLFTMCLPPLLAGTLIAALRDKVSQSSVRADRATKDVWPSLAQQHADGFADLLSEGAGEIVTEIVLHVSGDGSTLDDGTPIPRSVLERIAPESFIRLLLHDAHGRPINASGRRRHPTKRQKRVVQARDKACVDCGATTLLEYDHQPPYRESKQTVVEELELVCAPCHHRRGDRGDERATA